MTASGPVCVACSRSEYEVPLVSFRYGGNEYHICPQHLPVLIHNPQALTGRLPGAEGMEAAQHHD